MLCEVGRYREARETTDKSNSCTGLDSLSGVQEVGAPIIQDS